MGTFTIAQLEGTAPTTTTSAVNVTLPGGVSRLTLTGSANLIATGNNLSDVITGNSGNDTLVAGGTVLNPVLYDTLVGGSGNDTFIVNSSTDTITEAPNSGNNTEETWFSTGLAANVQNLVGLGNAPLTLSGNALNNLITANSGADTLTAGSGLATLVGGSGTDTFVVNNSADVVQASSLGTNFEQTSVSITAAANVISLIPVGIADGLTLTGNSGNITLQAGNGNDTLVAGSGNDMLVTQNNVTTTFVGNSGAGVTTYDYNSYANATIINSKSSDVLDIGILNNTPSIVATSFTVNGVTDYGIAVGGTGGWIEVAGGGLNRHSSMAAPHPPRSAN